MVDTMVAVLIVANEAATEAVMIAAIFFARALERLLPENFSLGFIIHPPLL
jgi:hypothetical protein